MKMWSNVVYILVCMTVAHGYSCPTKEGTFYHADVDTGCQVYHRCDGTEMMTLTCPAGKAFDPESKQCKEQASVNCIETDSSHHLRHKRSSDEAEVYSIDVDHLKAGVKELIKTVIPMVGEKVKELSPAMYSHIETDYAPLIRKFRSELIPFIRNRVLPSAQKSIIYIRNMGGRIFEKIYKSYELSNSSHISIVSCADIAADLARDIDPLLKLGKYLTSRLNPHSRPRRSVDEEEDDAVLNMLVEFMEPVLTGIAESIQNRSISEVATDLNIDAESLKNVQKYLTTKLHRHSRSKRSVAAEEEEEEIPDMLVGFIEPVFARIISSIQKMTGGSSNTLTSKIFLPIIYEIAADRETTFYLKQIFWTMKSAFAPIFSDMLRQQEWNSGSETTVKIPRQQISDAWSKIRFQVKPLVKKVLRKHSKSILQKLADNDALIWDTIDRISMTSSARVDILIDSIIRFFEKHYEKFKTSSPTHYYSYALTEILRDLRPIEVTLGQLLLEYMKLTPNSLYNTFFSRNSLIYRLVMGEGAPHYAVPR